MVRAAFVARLAVYATALFVVATAQLPAASSSTMAALRTTHPDSVGPMRFVLAGVLLLGILIEVLRRRPVWH